MKLLENMRKSLGVRRLNGISIHLERVKFLVKIRNKLTGNIKEYKTYELADSQFFITLEYENFFGFKAFPKLFYQLIES